MVILKILHCFKKSIIVWFNEFDNEFCGAFLFPKWKWSQCYIYRSFFFEFVAFPEILLLESNEFAKSFRGTFLIS